MTCVKFWDLSTALILSLYAARAAAKSAPRPPTMVLAELIPCMLSTVSKAKETARDVRACCASWRGIWMGLRRGVGLVSICSQVDLVQRGVNLGVALLLYEEQLWIFFSGPRTGVGILVDPWIGLAASRYNEHLLWPWAWPPACGAISAAAARGCLTWDLQPQPSAKDQEAACCARVHEFAPRPNNLE
eukprot:CAMPEP_0115471900 /NCGR_PEP_ID=MMETSP0271-20121206/52765_1 /TAXON_ID=71861 /ORGANISM="Scrippsiella trochoidea, Strain CCMP3099" /LENGTH=187 /DNA_ID=CAMNT_0002899107 /DNA_START=342 /DNA_END=903 /DNA_ORIENTATION=+